MLYYGILPGMAKERTYSQVLNLRIDEAMQREIARIAAAEGKPESETARGLIEWGIKAHRAREAALLRLDYSVDPTDLRDRYGAPMTLEVAAQWVQDPAWAAEDDL